MAAGKGSRISRHIQGKAKCTVDLFGTPLIKRTFEVLTRSKITDIALVTGYKEYSILRLLEDYDFTRFYNPFFDVTNSIASLWMAKEFISLDEDLLIMNGDLFIEGHLIEILENEKKSPILLADSSRIEEADYRFQWKNNLLIKSGKELSNDETTGEYVGIAKISKSDIPLFLETLEKMIFNQEHHKWWEDILYSLSPQIDIHIKDIKGNFWAEVDYIEDYHRIVEYLKGK